MYSDEKIYTNLHIDLCKIYLFMYLYIVCVLIDNIWTPTHINTNIHTHERSLREVKCVNHTYYSKSCNNVRILTDTS